MLWLGMELQQGPGLFRSNWLRKIYGLLWSGEIHDRTGLEEMGPPAWTDGPLIPEKTH